VDDLGPPIAYIVLEEDTPMYDRGGGLSLAVILFGLVAMLGFAPAGAGAQVVHCGDVVSGRVVVENDLTNCPGDGLRVGSAGTKIDLAGHVIDGTNNGSGVVSPGLDRIDVENGTIREFSKGVDLDESSSGLVRRVRTERNTFGISLYESERTLVERNSGADIVSIGLSEATDNRVRENRIKAASIGIGIYLYPGSHGNLVESNSVQTTTYGIIVFDASDNRLIRNSLVFNTIAGIWISGSSGVVVERNSATNNSEDGIFLASNNGPTLVQRNEASGNGDDGIDTDSPTTTLAKNRANGNGDLGIEAVPGVVDGGGNMASGNGDSAQCLNVACQP
jgi:parallel beta-helix repeat protein